MFVKCLTKSYFARWVKLWIDFLPEQEVYVYEFRTGPCVSCKYEEI